MALRQVRNDFHGPENEAYDRLAAGIIYECTQEDESSRLSPLLQVFGKACGIPTVNPTDEGAGSLEQVGALGRSELPSC